MFISLVVKIFIELSFYYHRILPLCFTSAPNMSEATDDNGRDKVRALIKKKNEIRATLDAKLTATFAEQAAAIAELDAELADIEGSRLQQLNDRKAEIREISSSQLTNSFATEAPGYAWVKYCSRVI